ncbi:MAG: hypothetical protein FJZ80_04230 [Bacteroidetes bacterium]|nr:hypothetical protein [Bacteroidota bacterium]
MKNSLLTLIIFMAYLSYGQTVQNVNKTSGTVSMPIAQIDSIRFNTLTNQMEIIQTNGSAENHVILDIINVTFSGDWAGVVSALNCENSTITGTLLSGIAANGVAISIPYTGGNGGAYSAQNIPSTGVLGLTATLVAGTFANGSGNLMLNISGTPLSSGTAIFVLAVGEQSCTLTLNVSGWETQYPPNSVFCFSGGTAVVDVTNPTTGQIWMDRSLGARQVASSSVDQNAHGDLYQWGRREDGHQCRNSPTTAILSSMSQPSHGDFILSPGAPSNWVTPQNNNLWQGVSGFNNPCPIGYRLPTETELNNERISWSSNNSVGALASPLKWTMGGVRSHINGQIYAENELGGSWTSTIIGPDSRLLNFVANDASMGGSVRAFGLAVRCIKN